MIKVYCGPMFAGKTSALINEITRFRIAKKRVIVFKPEIDCRYSEDEIVTHSGERVKCIRTKISQMHHDAMQNDVVIFDEVQFFESSEIIDLINQCQLDNKIVICGGLDMDYNGNPFRTTADLMAIADEVHKLRAVCVKCGADATMTQLTTGYDYTQNPVKIGGSECYEARCFQCWTLD